MSKAVPVENCTGCSACSSVCPESAIQMVENSEGFLYPHIDEKLCSGCEICLKKCPVHAVLFSSNNYKPTLYASWTKNSELLEDSTSGGIFSELAIETLSQGGVVFGAAYDDVMKVNHIAVETNDGLALLRGSKYVQSDIGATYDKAKVLLKEGRKVLFSGAPCQISGLYAAVGKKQNNLTTCSFICHGVPSPKVFRKAIEELEIRMGANVSRLIFREKSCGWLYPTVQTTFTNGKKIRQNNTDHPFNLGFLKNIYLRSCCYQCPEKNSPPTSDFTLGDFWSLIKHEPSIINGRGTSALLINSQKGLITFEKIKNNLFTKKCTLAYIEKDSNLYKSSKCPLAREKFFSEIDSLSFAQLSDKYIKPRNIILAKVARFRRLARSYMSKLK